jgi:hypothetical protein
MGAIKCVARVGIDPSQKRQVTNDKLKPVEGWAVAQGPVDWRMDSLAFVFRRSTSVPEDSPD